MPLTKDGSLEQHSGQIQEAGRDLHFALETHLLITDEELRKLQFTYSGASVEKVHRAYLVMVAGLSLSVLNQLVQITDQKNVLSDSSQESDIVLNIWTNFHHLTIILEATHCITKAKTLSQEQKNILWDAANTNSHPLFAILDQYHASETYSQDNILIAYLFNYFSQTHPAIFNAIEHLRALVTALQQKNLSTPEIQADFNLLAMHVGTLLPVASKLARDLGEIHQKLNKKLAENNPFAPRNSSSSGSDEFYTPAQSSAQLSKTGGTNTIFTIEEEENNAGASFTNNSRQKELEETKQRLHAFLLGAVIIRAGQHYISYLKSGTVVRGQHQPRDKAAALKNLARLAYIDQSIRHNEESPTWCQNESHFQEIMSHLEDEKTLTDSDDVIFFQKALLWIHHLHIDTFLEVAPTIEEAVINKLAIPPQPESVSPEENWANHLETATKQYIPFFLGEIFPATKDAEGKKITNPHTGFVTGIATIGIETLIGVTLLVVGIKLSMMPILWATAAVAGILAITLAYFLAKHCGLGHEKQVPSQENSQSGTFTSNITPSTLS